MEYLDKIGGGITKVGKIAQNVGDDPIGAFINVTTNPAAFVLNPTAVVGTLAASAPAIGLYATYKQSKAAERAADAEREARKKQEAQEQASFLRSKRQQLREQRVRQARLLAASSAKGVAGSSGALGSAGAATTLFGGALAFQTGQTIFNQAISADLQEAADAKSDATKWGYIGAASQDIFSASKQIVGAF